MKYLFAAGGTAGHVNPALAIAEILTQKDKNAEIFFLGSLHGVEGELLKKAGYPLYKIAIHGFERRLSIKNLRSLYFALLAPARAKRIIKRLSPDIVIGTGGYVSWPAAVAAHSLHIPVVLHESNAYPGLSIRMSEKKVDKILLNFEEAKKHLKHPEKAVAVGNPIRSGFRETREAARARLGLREGDVFLLSFGGSLGASVINENILSWLDEKGKYIENLYCTHSLGINEAEKYADFLGRHRFPSRFRILPYIDNIGSLMNAADVTVSRAGASTVTELAASRAAAILIPSPYVAEDHQMKNAKALEKRGAAVLLDEKTLTKRLFSETLEGLIASKQEREKMRERIKSFYSPRTNALIYREIASLL